MKKYNTTVTVEVEVDSIAQALLNTMKKDFPHREILTETIIDLGLEFKTLGLIHSNLSGWKNEIDFEVGQMVRVSDAVWLHLGNKDTSGHSDRIGEIKKINTIKKTVVVEFPDVTYKGKTDTKMTTVSIKYLYLVTDEEINEQVNELDTLINNIVPDLVQN